MEIDDISFDFSHPELLSKEELKGQLIQVLNADVFCEQTPLQVALVNEMSKPVGDNPNFMT